MVWPVSEQVMANSVLIERKAVVRVRWTKWLHEKATGSFIMDTLGLYRKSASRERHKRTDIFELRSERA